MFTVLVLGNVPDVQANILLTPQATPVAGKVTIPEDLSPEQVGEFIAPLNEQQVRSLLIENVQQRAILYQENNSSQPMTVFALLKSAGDPESELGRGIKATIRATQTFSQEAHKVIDQLTPGRGFIGFLTLLGLLLLSIVVAAAIERFALYRLNYSATPIATSTMPAIDSRSISSQLMVNFLGLIIFAIAGFIVIKLTTPEIEIQADFVNRLFGAILVYRLFTTLFKLALYPAPQGFALIDDRINRVVLYRCMAGFTFAYTFGTELVFFFAEQGLPFEHKVLAFMFLFGLIVNPIVFWFVWTQREDVDRIMFGSKEQSRMMSGPYPYASRAMIWPSVITFMMQGANLITMYVLLYYFKAGALGAALSVCLIGSCGSLFFILPRSLKLVQAKISEYLAQTVILGIFPGCIGCIGWFFLQTTFQPTKLTELLGCLLGGVPLYLVSLWFCLSKLDKRDIIKLFKRLSGKFLDLVFF